MSRIFFDTDIKFLLERCTEDANFKKVLEVIIAEAEYTIQVIYEKANNTLRIWLLKEGIDILMVYINQHYRVHAGSGKSLVFAHQLAFDLKCKLYQGTERELQNYSEIII